MFQRAQAAFIAAALADGVAAGGADSNFVHVVKRWLPNSKLYKVGGRSGVRIGAIYVGCAFHAKLSSVKHQFRTISN